MGEARRKKLAELDAVEKMMRGFEGKDNAILPKDITADQLGRSLYVLAKEKPCYLCEAPEVFSIGKFEVPEALQASTGPFVLFGLCSDCTARHLDTAPGTYLTNQILADLEEMEKARISVM
jgi:hypothetical protein